MKDEERDDNIRLLWIFQLIQWILVWYAIIVR